MPKTKTGNNYPEIADIRSDLDSLKDNVVELTKHLKKDQNHQVEEIKAMLADKWHKVQDTSREQIDHLETRVKEKPAQSIGIAFAAGLVASYLLTRRS